MIRNLKHVYFGLMMPAVAGFILTGVIESAWLPEFGFSSVPLPVAAALLVLAAAVSIAFPIYYRARFSHRNRHKNRITEKNLYRFERNLMSVPLLTPYLALAAYLLKLPHFHLTAIALMSLYAAYYFYPSNRRISFERRVFRSN